MGLLELFGDSFIGFLLILLLAPWFYYGYRDIYRKYINWVCRIMNP